MTSQSDTEYEEVSRHSLNRGDWVRVTYQSTQNGSEQQREGRYTGKREISRSNVRSKANRFKSPDGDFLYDAGAVLTAGRHPRRFGIVDSIERDPDRSERDYDARWGGVTIYGYAHKSVEVDLDKLEQMSHDEIREWARSHWTGSAELSEPSVVDTPNGSIDVG